MATTVKPDTPASKELRALGRQMKQGYRFERSGGGHFRVRDRQDNLVEFRGRPISVSGNPSDGVLRAFEEQLREAQILRGTRLRIPDEAAENRKTAQRAMMEARSRRRQEEANELRDSLAAVFAPMGGIELKGLPSDLGHVATILIRDTEKRATMTPDLLTSSAHRLNHGDWVEPRYQEDWRLVIDRLTAAPDAGGEWYSLIREARGLPSDTVQLRMPEGEEWPFRVELLPLDALLVDEAYQRPVSWPFVRREAARFDHSLVGTIDVAQRSPSTFAILDGQQRSQIVRLVGKGSIWCSIYVGLDLQSEARFFLLKNRDRKSVHPYYTFRAMFASGEPDAVAIQGIDERYGYRLNVQAANERHPEQIAAVSALTTAYGRKRASTGATRSTRRSGRSGPRRSVATTGRTRS